MSEEAEEARESGVGYFRGLVTGLLFGAAAALLLAPKRGEELRHELADNASRLKDRASDLGGNVAGTARDVGGTVAQRARDLKGRTEEFAGTLRAKGSEVAGEAAHYAEDVKTTVAETAQEVKAQATGEGDAQQGQMQPAKEEVKDQAHDVVESV